MNDQMLQEESRSIKSKSDQETALPIQASTTSDVNKRSWIRYRTEYLDQNNDDIVWEENSRTPFENRNDGLDSIRDPIFEILTIYRARVDSTKTTKRASQPGERKREGPPPRSFGTPPRYKLRIYSSALRNALNSVVRYYPSQCQSLNGDTLEVDWPYTVLVHHYDELAEFRRQILLKEPGELCTREIHAPEDIQELLE